MHYMDYINRNSNILNQVSSEGTKAVMIQHIQWALELVKRLNSMDFDQQQEAISKIVSVMNEDFKAAGFELNEDLEATAEIPTL